MTLNPKAKPFMKNQKQALVDNVKAAFPTIDFFEDEIGEDEEKKYKNSKYSAFVLSMGDFTPNENESYLSQDIAIDYYSEQRDDLDEMILDIIAAVTASKQIKFVGTTKLRAKVKDTSRFIDVVNIEFRRNVKYGC